MTVMMMLWWPTGRPSSLLIPRLSLSLCTVRRPAHKSNSISQLIHHRFQSENKLMASSF